MPVNHSAYLALILALAPLMPSRAQQIMYRADSAKVARAVESGARLVHWVETVPDAGQHILYARNVTNRPVRVSSYEVYECMEVRGRVCGIHEGPVVQPGKTVRLAVITFRGGGGSYKYRVNAEFADSIPGDSTRQ